MVHHPQQLSEAQKAEFNEAFKLFDKDDDGFITTGELRMVMRSLEQNPTDAELQEMIREADEDGNGQINFEEFLGLMTRKLRHDDSELKEAFRIFDRDQNNLISGDELGLIMKKLGASVSQVDIDEMMKEADLDHDGAINYDEFVAIMLAKKQEGAANRGENGGGEATTKSTGRKKSPKLPCAIL